MLDKINEQLRKSLEVLDNPYVSSVLSLVIILYASLAAPRLPASASALFNNAWFRLLVLFTIAYIGAKDPSIAIIVALAFTITLQTLHSQSLQSQLAAYVEGVPYVGPRVMNRFRGMSGGGSQMHPMMRPMMRPDGDAQTVDLAYQVPTDGYTTEGMVDLVPPNDQGFYMPNSPVGGCTSFVERGKMGDYPQEGAVVGYDDMSGMYNYVNERRNDSTDVPMNLN